MIIACKGKLWAIGEKIKKIVCINTQDNSYISVPFSKVETIADVNCDTLLWSNSYLVRDNIILIPCRNANFILKIDSATEKIQMIQLSENEYCLGYRGIFAQGEFVNLIDYINGNRITLNNELNIVKIERIFTIQNHSISVWKSFSHNDKIIIVGFDIPKVWVIDEEGVIEKEFDFKDSCMRENMVMRVACFQFSFIRNGKLFFQRRSDGAIFCIDLLDMKCERYVLKSHNIDVSLELNQQYVKKIKKLTEDACESLYITLSDFLNAIMMDLI